MDPVTLSLLIGAGTGLLQGGLGLSDRAKGKKKLREAQSFFDKNKYAIPESAKAALGSAERQAAGVRLPAEDLRRAQIAEATAGGVGAVQQAATSASDVLGSLSQLYRGQQEAEQDLAIAGAERYDRNQAMLRQELGRMADLERERWQYNTLYPYQQMLGQAEAYQTRGAQGIGQGLGMIGSAAGGFAQMSSAEQQYQDFLGSMGLGNQSPYAGMNNRQKYDFYVAQEKLKQSRQGLPSYDMKYETPQLRVG